MLAEVFVLWKDDGAPAPVPTQQLEPGVINQVAAPLFREYLLAYELTSVLLLAVSPWFVFMSMSLMSHQLALACTLAAALAVARARESGGVIGPFLGGLAIGVLSLIRPLEGVAVAGDAFAVGAPFDTIQAPSPLVGAVHTGFFTSLLGP